MPQTIVSDHDPLFISSLWRELFHLQGISLAFSSAYHPNLMAKLSPSTSVLKLTSVAILVLNQRIGVLVAFG
jgi:hypothetical protein